MEKFKKSIKNIKKGIEVGFNELWEWASRLHVAIYIVIGVFLIGLYVILQSGYGAAKALAITSLLIVFTILIGLIVNIAPDFLAGLSSFASVVIVASFASQGIAFETGFIIQPFLISFVIYFLMLSITYNPDPHYLNRSLKNRWLWSSLITITHIIIKSTLVISLNIRYWISEGVAVAIGLSLILLWILWVKSSPKTKLNHPKSVIASSEGDEDVVIRIDDHVNYENKWENGENAIPWLFVQATLAADKGKNLIVIQRSREDSKSFSIEFGQNIWEQINVKLIEE